jgi:glucose-1-phosphate thymidylyltransferase
VKLIVPMARKPVKDSSSFIPPSPLLSLVGRPILFRVLDVVKGLKITEVIFIVDKDDVELKALVSKNYKFKIRYVLQKDQKGVAHAIYGAKKFVNDEPCMVLFADSITKADFKFLSKLEEDAVIWTKQVDDPRNFGVVFTHDGLVSRLIEKPETPVSDLAMVGMYYFKRPALLFDAISYLIKNKILTKGAYQLTDALQIMINKGSKIAYKNIDYWLDCGSKARLLEAHKHVIVENKTTLSKGMNNVFIQPVFVDKGAVVSKSIIGPNVSVGRNATVSESILVDTIVSDEAMVEKNNLNESFVGRKAKVYGSLKKVNVKDHGVVRDE